MVIFSHFVTEVIISQNPRPLFVSQCQHLPYPHPLLPLSAIVTILKKKNPLSAIVSIFQPTPPFRR